MTRVTTTALLADLFTSR